MAVLYAAGATHNVARLDFLSVRTYHEFKGLRSCLFAEGYDTHNLLHR